jgi:hypothetical protein
VVFHATVPGYAAALCVAVSSTSSAPDRVERPSEQTALACRSGLPRACAAVPEWVLLVAHADLWDKRGWSSGALLTKLKLAIARASDEQRTTLRRAPDDP